MIQSQYEGRGTEEVDDLNLSLRVGKEEVFQLSREAVGKKEQLAPFPVLCFIQDLSGLDDACPHWGGQFTLLNLLIQMLTSSANTDTSAIMLNLGAPWCSQVDIK